MYTSLKCKCTVRKEHRALIARLFEKETYKFYIETNDPYIKLFNMPYNFSKLFEAKVGVDESKMHNMYDQQTGAWSFNIRFIQIDEEWLWFARLFVPLYVQEVFEFKMGYNDRLMPYRVATHLDETGVNGVLRYLFGESSAAAMDWKKYQLKSPIHPSDEIRRKVIREQNTLYLDITDTHCDKYGKDVLEYLYAEIDIEAMVERVNYNRFQTRDLSRYVSRIKPLIFEENHLPASFEVVLSEILEKINNCEYFNQKELPEVWGLKIKFKHGNEVKINLSRISIENQEVVERWVHDECIYDY